MRMISRKLLSDVLGHGEADIVDRPDEKHVWYSYRSDPEQTVRHINIHELTHKCKEWAIDKGHEILSGPARHPVSKTPDKTEWEAMVNHRVEFGADGYREKHDYKDIWNDSEPEAVFKACEWILERGKQ
jgi:hypothetical protein